MTRHKSQDERRRQILDAARRSFIERGFERSRVDDIAAGAGLSKGGVYFHFSSKREIFDALLTDEFDLAMSSLAEVQALPGPASARLGWLAARYLRRFANEPDSTRFPLVVGEIAVRDDAVRERLRELHVEYLSGFAALLEAGVQGGEFRAVRARTAALLLKAIIDGIERQFAIGNALDDLDAMIVEGLDIIMNGLATPPGDRIDA